MNAEVRLAWWAVTAPAVFAWRAAVGLWRLWSDGDRQDIGTRSRSRGNRPGVSRPTGEAHSQPYVPHGTPETASQSARHGAGNGPEGHGGGRTTAADPPGHPHPPTRRPRRLGLPTKENR